MVSKKDLKQVRIWVHPSLKAEINFYQKNMQKLNKKKRYTKVEASKRIADLLKTIRKKTI